MKVRVQSHQAVGREDLVVRVALIAGHRPRVDFGGSNDVLRGDPCLWRRAGELEAWQERCPIDRLRRKLIAANVVSESELARIDQQAEQEMEEAAAFARESPLPDPETALDYVY